MQTSAQACPAVRELPGRSDAELALAAAFESGRLSFHRVVIYLPDHVAQLIEDGRYDPADRALLSFCHSLVHVLPAGARLYRWSATSLVVLTGSEEAAATLVASGLSGVSHQEIFTLTAACSPATIARELDSCVARNL